jgi:hypothetical protein
MLVLMYRKKISFSLLFLLLVNLDKSCSRSGLHGEREAFVLNDRKKQHFKVVLFKILGIISKLFACHF